MSSDWIWQQADWPHFHWDNRRVAGPVRQVTLLLGVLLGKTAAHPDELQTLDTLLANILSSSAIEGEQLNVHSVRSSLARRLGVDEEKPYPVTDQSEGVARIMLDAIEQARQPLSLERLCQWHVWLFPAPESLLISRPRYIGSLRGEATMQVVSGREDRPHVHFEAPGCAVLDAEVERFIDWFNNSQNDPTLDPLIRAALVHLWFVTLHPFDDGNGRITRALTDMALAQADEQGIRLYAMPVSILKHHKQYYDILETTQCGGLDVTDWLLWFLECLQASMQQSIDRIDRLLVKTRFWRQFQVAGLNPEQTKVLNRLLDGGDNGFADGISASQYQKVAQVSKATATRHLTALLTLGCIEKLPGGGRSTRYRIAGGLVSDQDV
jgi:Fic family protein